MRSSPIPERIEIEDAKRTRRVPALLYVPAGASATRPCAAALLLHGLTSSKERMAESVGHALLAHGVASVSADLPLHGERATDDNVSMRNPLAIAGAWRLAQQEARDALAFLSARPEVDSTRLGLVGYSMGAFLSVAVAASADIVRAVVLAAGGDLPAEMPYARVVRTIADPIASVRRLAGRPLLMVHGRHDRTVTAEQAERLFAAASEPKELRWWNAGHYLPDTAVDDAAAWLAERLGARAL